VVNAVARKAINNQEGENAQQQGVEGRAEKRSITAGVIAGSVAAALVLVVATAIFVGIAMAS
jgi:hypothetical protein